MWIDETGLAVDHVDAVAGHLILDEGDLVRDHVVGAEGEVLDRDVGFHTIAGAVEIALSEAGQVEDGLAQGFAGNGAGMDANAADHLLPLDDADVFSELGGLNGGLLTGRPRANDQKVVVPHEHLNGRGRPDFGKDSARLSDLPRLSQLTVISLRAT